MSTYAVPRDLTGFESVKTFQQYEAHGVTGIFCGAADVWSQKHILQCTVPRIYLRFIVENIQAGGEYLPGDQRFNQRIVVDHLSSGNVHHNGVAWQQLNASTIEESGETRGSRGRDQENVAHPEQAFRSAVVHSTLLRAKRQGPSVVIV